MLARMTTSPRRKISSLGDVNPEYGGTVLYRDQYGYHLEHWDEPEDDDLPASQQEVEVYRADVPDDVFGYHNWVNVADVARTMGMSATDLRADGRSADPTDRARAVEAIAMYHGWQNLDESPATFTIAELKRRWRSIYGAPRKSRAKARPNGRRSLALPRRRRV